MTSWLETIGVGLLMGVWFALSFASGVLFMNGHMYLAAIVFIAGVVMSQVTFRVMNR